MNDDVYRRYVNINLPHARTVAARIGRSLDMPAIAQAIVADPAATSVRARFRISRPERTTAEAKALRITELVSQESEQLRLVGAPRLQDAAKGAVGRGPGGGHGATDDAG